MSAPIFTQPTSFEYETALAEVNRKGEILREINLALRPLPDEHVVVAARRVSGERDDAVRKLDQYRGIIARNALQRLAGPESKEFFVTAQDIKDSLEVLYEWQKANQ